MFGTRGAAVATVLAEFCVFVILMIYMKKFYQDRSLFTEVWKYCVAGIAMFGVGKIIALFGLGLISKILITVVGCAVIYYSILLLLNANIAYEITGMVKSILKEKLNKK